MKKKASASRASRRRFWLAVQVLAGLAAVAALALLAWTWWGYRQSARAFQALQQQYTAPAASTASDPSGQGFSLLEVDFEALRQDWPDVVAWIQWPLMGLDHPIVQGSTNTQYLRALPDGSWNNGGSIFLEANNETVLDWHAIVYGHNMRDGSMFGQLMNFLDEDFCQQYADEAWFVLYTPEGVWRYDLFSVEQVMSTDPGVYMVGYLPGDEFTAFVQAMKGRSAWPVGPQPDGTAPVMTLSTCTSVGAEQGHRITLHAVQGQRLDQPAD